MAPEVPKQTRVPRASDLLLTQSVTSIEPPTEVREKLGSSQLMIGVDIETHDWEERRGNQGSLGQFGFYSLCPYRADWLDDRIARSRAGHEGTPD